ncbi:hypothetical protein SADUNF_Sadunf15G0058000 [Salix dunnii]|uniref:Uncharacterized protein n=1 Tax=Salix dunnii TaxID=1413687 RepID=A0A835JC83_9ROSI|nr:hypothetical protein SADUNF_Sadunf15G0058000 [Salix dunnii]
MGDRDDLWAEEHDKKLQGSPGLFNFAHLAFLKTQVFQLRFRTFRSIMNHCDIIVANIFDDVIDGESLQQHVEPEFYDINVPFIKEVDAFASKKPLLLNPITLTHISPSAIDSTAKALNILSLLDDNTSAMSKEKDPPKKCQCRSKELPMNNVSAHFACLHALFQGHYPLLKSDDTL